MSDPFFHLVSGSLVGGIVGTEISDRVGCNVNPMFIFIGAGAVSVFVDAAQITRLKAAGWSYVRLVLDAGEFQEIYNYHGVLLVLVMLVTMGVFLYRQSARASNLRNEARKANKWLWLFATLTTVVFTHVFFDTLLQCAIWPKSICSWMGG